MLSILAAYAAIAGIYDHLKTFVKGLTAGALLYAAWRVLQSIGHR